MSDVAFMIAAPAAAAAVAIAVTAAAPVFAAVPIAFNVSDVLLVLSLKSFNSSFAFAAAPSASFSCVASSLVCSEAAPVELTDALNSSLSSFTLSFASLYSFFKTLS